MAVSFTKTKDQIPLGTPTNVGALLLVEGELVVGSGDTAVSGGAAGDLPASLFALKRVVNVLSVVKSDDAKAYFGNVASDGSVVIGGGASAALQDLPEATYNIKLLGTY